MSDVSQPIRNWSTALPDWEERIMEGRSIIPELPVYDIVAEKALRIFKRLQVPDLIGTPTYGEVCDPWVFDFVRVIFGCFDEKTKQRAIQEFFLLVPKKNGKSAIAAAIILTAAIMNERPYAECVLIAPTQEVAKIAFKQIKGMIALDDDLSIVFHVRDHMKKIEHQDLHTEIKIQSADGDVVTGSKATYILVDETHVLGAKPKAAEIFLELRGGLASRPDGFFLQITTQSKTPPSGQFKEELLQARAVRDGTVDFKMLPVLYELPAKVARSGGWRKEENWGLVNPHLDRSVSRDWLRNEFAKKEAAGVEALSLFASQHFNVEIGVGIGSWIGSEYWARNSREELTLERILDTSDVVVMGGDAGGADDLFSIGLIGRHAETRVWQAWVRAWCLDIVLTRRKEIAPRLRDFETQGDLIITESAEEHVEQAADLCMEVRASGKLPAEAALGLDQWGIAALLDALEERGFEDDRITGVFQGFKLNGSIKGIERRLFDGKLVHGDQAMLNWSVTNARAEQRGNNVLITKQQAGSAKIDPLMSLFNCAFLMDRNPKPSNVSIDAFLSSPVMAA